MNNLHTSTRRGVLGLLAAGTLALAGTAVAPSFAADHGQVFFVQGLPGTQVDLAIDGHSVAKNVKTAALVGPFDVSGGERSVSVSSGG